MTKTINICGEIKSKHFDCGKLVTSYYRLHKLQKF